MIWAPVQGTGQLTVRHNGLFNYFSLIDSPPQASHIQHSGRWRVCCCKRSVCVICIYILQESGQHFMQWCNMNAAIAILPPQVQYYRCEASLLDILTVFEKTCESLQHIYNPAKQWIHLFIFPSEEIMNWCITSCISSKASVEVNKIQKTSKIRWSQEVCLCSIKWLTLPCIVFHASRFNTFQMLLWVMWLTGKHCTSPCLLMMCWQCMMSETTKHTRKMTCNMLFYTFIVWIKPACLKPVFAQP